MFDILTVNGKSLESASLRKRREILQNIMGESKGRVEFHPFKTCSTGEDVMRALDDAILNNEEGIVIKNPRSKYVPDGRLPLWIKIKPDYVEGLSDPVDLAVIGGWYGSGGRGKLVSHYLCAVQGPRNEVDGTMTYRTFCKVGSGMNYKEMEGVSKLPWRQFNRDKPPKWLQAGRALKVTPDVILDPQHFPIVAVKAEKIVPSAEYAIGYTLRFPRLQAFRHDKPNEDIWTENEVEGAMVGFHFPHF